MKAEFEMNDLGNLSYFLGIEFTRSKEGILMHQRKYSNDVLKRFNMEHCNLASTPMKTSSMITASEVGTKSIDKTLYRQIIGCLRYICNTRPDIAYSVGVVSRFMESPKRANLLDAKIILRYVKGTINLGILLPAGSSL
ncbi:hypothetical protein TanjilG_05653 [Lupinus angustifolius]|uniref:Reverse transcriptase Ty1/copia-type domain-containing protein n=1 Tax=Lupinus angustifolius TaxID=3871 RepID=A0A4P1QSE9_LUPAN|nr:PREDICTED: uncharacterized protein LOC109330939 [Lupinus angustifolius]OIV93950.1 hypothetical protein TanjilG_05653 [Lupinus angustifolius]